MKKRTRQPKKPKVKQSGLKTPKPFLFNKNNNNVTVGHSSNSDAENNNVQSPKFKIISNHKIVSTTIKPINNKGSSQNEHGFENVLTKIEITDHDLELANIQTLESIHKDYDEILACDSPLSVESISSFEDEEFNSVEDADLEQDLSKSTVEDEDVYLVEDKDIEQTLADSRLVNDKDIEQGLGKSIIVVDLVEDKEIEQDLAKSSIVVDLVEDKDIEQDLAKSSIEVDLVDDKHIEQGLANSTVNNIKIASFKIEKESRKSDREKKFLKQLTLDSSFVRPKKRKFVDRRKPPKKIEELEKYEKLFVRLVKMDFSLKLNEIACTTNDLIVNNTSIDLLSDMEETPEKPVKVPKHDFCPKIVKPTKKVSKTELQSQNVLNINKTESIRMEELLMKKFQKVKEKQAASGESSNEAEDSTIQFEPYVYEKTNKSLYETYERTEDENGEMKLCCLLCPFSSERFQQMSLHYKFKHKETPIEEMHFCNVKGCKFKAVHQGMMTWHTKRHMLAADKITTDLYPCSQCDKVFDQRKGYLIHLKHKHKDPAPSTEVHDFPCATCKFRTTNKVNLQAHIYRCHVPDNIKQVFTCNVCGFETYSRDSLKKHLNGVHLKL